MARPPLEKIAEFCRDFELPLYGDKIRFEFGAILQKRLDFLLEETGETKNAIEAALSGTENQPEAFIPLAAEILDGCGDVIVIAFNTMILSFMTLGSSFDTAKLHAYEVLDRIAQSNLSQRQPDGSVKIIDNKIQKPEGWGAPQFSDLLPTPRTHILTQAAGAAQNDKRKNKNHK